jgi:hypothetical protein
MQWSHPASFLLTSPSGGGKSTMMLEIIRQRDKLFDTKMFEVLYFYNVWNSSWDAEKDISFIKDDSLPIPEDGKPRLIACDDLITSKVAQKRLISIFLVGRHLSCSILFSTQDSFFSKEMRSISINANTFILFPSPRNYLSIANLFRQMIFDKNFLKAVYLHCTRETYGYLVINLQRSISEELRFCTDIFSPTPRFFVGADFAKKLPLAVSFNGPADRRRLQALAVRSASAATPARGSTDHASATSGTDSLRSVQQH